MAQAQRVLAIINPWFYTVMVTPGRCVLEVINKTFNIVSLNLMEKSRFLPALSDLEQILKVRGHR